MLYFLTGCFCMIAVSFSRLEGWAALACLIAVFVTTYRLLRNLDAFSLDLDSDPRSEDGMTTGCLGDGAVSIDEGEEKAV